MLHRKFPQRKLSVYYIRKVYQDYNIKKKKIRKTKIVTHNHQLKIDQEAKEARTQL